jgi:hypothetical protein
MENKSYKAKRRPKPEIIEFNIPLQKKCEHNFCIYKGSEIHTQQNSEWTCTKTYSCAFCGLNQRRSHDGF